MPQEIAVVSMADKLMEFSRAEGVLAIRGLQAALIDAAIALDNAATLAARSAPADAPFKYRMVLKFDGGVERVYEGEYPASPSETQPTHIADVLAWADGVTGALGTEHAGKVTVVEARIAAAIQRAEEEHATPSAIAPTWEPCDKNDPRFLKACFVIYDVRYLGTVRSNGDTYDHFVAPAPEFK